MQHQAGKNVPSDALGGAVLSKNSSGNFEVFPTGWIDGTNNVAKVARLLAAGTVLTADGNTLTGVGLLARIVVSNSHATDKTTVAVYDNTSATGTKLCADLVVSAGATLAVDIESPYALGVYLDFTGGTPSAIGYGQLVL